MATADTTLDFSKLPPDSDFIVGSTNSGLAIHAQIGDVEEYGDTVQEAFDNAVASFNKRSDALLAEVMDDLI